MSDPINANHYYLRSGGEPPQLPQPNPPQPRDNEEDSESDNSLHLSDISAITTDTFIDPPVNNLNLEMAHRLEMPKFDGCPGRKAVDWFTQYNRYCDLLNLDEERKAKMIQFFLSDHALAFYNSLDEETKDDYPTLCDGLISRFDGSDGTVELLDLQQKHGEPSSSFFTRVLSATNQRGCPEQLLISIVLRGLKPELRQIVMPQNLQTVEELRKATHLAERTLGFSNTSNVAAFTDILTAQIQGLADKIASMESRTYQRPPQNSWTPRPRHPAYQHQDLRRHQPAPFPHKPEHFPSPLRQNGTGCQRCGNGKKHSLNQCKARDITCNHCFKVGHLYQYCFKRLNEEANGSH
ncbi:uncharacterized protein LOC132720099 [Ruditapes philippinarum]|uniref:uncharacterized protein LOC132720099 n=1 Tax=Ruditapes philippinarum TaxID=129788 RepID=UPI00295A7E17|nr:uncharacterized protein LOC132720099 [Ruditapes philippinarum]